VLYGDAGTSPMSVVGRCCRKTKVLERLRPFE
jgi:hypothetical protein